MAAACISQSIFWGIPIGLGGEGDESGLKTPAIWREHRPTPRAYAPSFGAIFLTDEGRKVTKLRHKTKAWGERECGTPSGYRMHLYLGEETCAECRLAWGRYNKRVKAAMDLGRGSRLIPIQGTVRRLQALMCLGWPMSHILDQAGLKRQSILHFESRERVHRNIAAGIAKAYDELSMKLPDPKQIRPSAITMAKKHARARGYVPPLAWDDIDNDIFNPAHHLRRIA